MNTKEYAVVDIETTGGSAKESRITEIAVLIYNGTKVIQRWETLINPQQQIPPYITALTGITNEMVQEAPLFSTIANELLQLLSDRIFVAHNVNFDYSFIRHQLQEVGLTFKARKLCTVRATRRIIPGLPSYNLGNVCKSLNISLQNRHRAGGDADATAVLLGKLLEQDTTNELAKMIKKTAPDQRLPPNVPPADIENLPEKPGVYYFYNVYHKVIYVGKAINLKKRVISHFTGNKINAQRQHFLREIHHISFEICGTELMALILEYNEIKKNWPAYNTALKKFEPKYGLYEYTARNGYKYLAVGKVSKSHIRHEIFGTVTEAIDQLRTLKEKFLIDYRFCIYAVGSKNEIPLRKDSANLPAVDEHNKKIQQAIDYITDTKPSYFILDQGRTSEEKSCIWIANGHFYGMGYVPNDVSIMNHEHLIDFVTRYQSSTYVMQLITAHVFKYPHKVHYIPTVIS